MARNGVPASDRIHGRALLTLNPFNEASEFTLNALWPVLFARQAKSRILRKFSYTQRFTYFHLLNLQESFCRDSLLTLS